MGTEAELNGMAMEVTNDCWVAQVSARPHRIKNREAIKRDVAAVHPSVEIKGHVGFMWVRDGGFPYGSSPCVEASEEPAKRVFSGDGEDAKWHWLGLLLSEFDLDLVAGLLELHLARCRHSQFPTTLQLHPRRKNDFGRFRTSGH